MGDPVTRTAAPAPARPAAGPCRSPSGRSGRNPGCPSSPSRSRTLGPSSPSRTPPLAPEAQGQAATARGQAVRLRRTPPGTWRRQRASSGRPALRMQTRKSGHSRGPHRRWDGPRDPGPPPCLRTLSPCPSQPAGPQTSRRSGGRNHRRHQRQRSARASPTRGSRTTGAGSPTGSPAGSRCRRQWRLRCSWALCTASCRTRPPPATGRARRSPRGGRRPGRGRSPARGSRREARLRHSPSSWPSPRAPARSRGRAARRASAQPGTTSTPWPPVRPDAQGGKLAGLQD
mmetsp:Transcript_4120/g.11071  ORF Transcript_4120/g.11071 Transcript_4120/m.11071 type:complete len:287 (+) Transcript_4120:120-980(+)